MFYLFKKIFKGNTLVRALMNKKCEEISLTDKSVLDLGSGAAPGSYHEFFKHPAKEVLTADMKSGDNNHKSLDFEKDPLPFESGTFDAVLSFNLFEHIFNHAQLVKETHRVIKKDGELIGFVPFMVNFHPDPQDFFRYTESALKKVFESAGFENVKIDIIGGGPFFVNYNNIVLSVPKLFRIIILPFYLFMDWLFLKLRPNARRRYPLGYFFIATKK